MENLNLSNHNFINFIEKAVFYNTVSHAYLIEISDYDKDFPLITIFVKLLLCKNSNHANELDCGKCNVCNLVDTNNYPDFRIIQPDGKEIKKQQIINLQEDFKKKSFLDNKQIYVIKEAEKLNLSAANTILKFLEEPEDNIIAILLTTNKFKVLDTIVSRCQSLSTSNDGISDDIFSEENFNLIKLLFSGDRLFTNYNDIISPLMSDKLVTKKKLLDIEKILMIYLDSRACKKTIINFDDILELLSSLSIEKIIKMISIIDDEVIKLEFNVNYKLWLDQFFAKVIGGNIDG